LRAEKDDHKRNLEVVDMQSKPTLGGSADHKRNLEGVNMESKPTLGGSADHKRNLEGVNMESKPTLGGSADHKRNLKGFEGELEKPERDDNPRRLKAFLRSEKDDHHKRNLNGVNMESMPVLHGSDNHKRNLLAKPVPNVGK